MKKLLTATLAVALVFGVSSAFAQTMSVAGEEAGGGLQQLFSPIGPQFDLVVTLDTEGVQASAAEFVVTELLVVSPGIFKTGTAKINNTPLDLGDNAVGEYVLSFAGCFGPEPLELIRVTYLAFSGPVAPDTVVELAGLGPDASQPSSFFGELGFVDCNDTKFAATMGGTDGGVTGTGVVFPDGAMVINPTPLAVDNTEGSVGQLKTRF